MNVAHDSDRGHNDNDLSLQRASGGPLQLSLEMPAQRFVHAKRGYSGTGPTLFRGIYVDKWGAHPPPRYSPPFGGKYT